MVQEDNGLDFSDANPLESLINLQSTWQASIPHSNNTGMMTDQLDMYSVGLQTTDRRIIATQTDSADQAAPKHSKASQAGLSDFVSRVEGLLSTEITKAVEEHEVLDSFVRVADDEQEPPTCLFELTAFPQDGSLSAIDPLGGQPRGTGQRASELHKPKKLVVTCVSWSASGSTVAAAYGRYDVVGWCTDRGALATWNVARKALDQSKPDTLIDVDNCLMACAFHPDHPALIAGGTFNGDLYVWDLSLEGDMQRSRTDAVADLRHREPICTIVWQYSMTEYNKYGNRSQAYRLVTLGADGRIMTWVWHKLEAPIYGYQLLWPSPAMDRKILWGGTCLSFQKDPQAAGRGAAQGAAPAASSGGAAPGGAEAGTFIVGTEGGKIFRCYADLNDAALKDFSRAAAAAAENPASGKSVELRVPIRDAEYSTHAGAVYGIDCSPYQRDLFLSGGADGSVRLYHALKQQALLVVEPCSVALQGVFWSPSRPLVFAAPAGDGRVYFYDLGRAAGGGGMLRPVLSLDSNPLGMPVTAAAFNARRPELFATGDATGVQVWQLPASLSEGRKGEVALLRRMAAADDLDELLRRPIGMR
mmetsp:Transcript_27063/g.59154  ORF Transcript_27063/g.59154 Transcript_27063/m.59154 type:complete len:588 (-) Transcript_27063:554-2317(-)|eukprot:CAMPEP_0202894496 /NCGR_PEP_ID=MMETSP1392-20130828/3895_1 /ASSEMBLY_ACC=CAM_ASM_000868 /TAXON_ID=225041 /ORGANISM="Chlamydomonas chlamydogama, Strain SAG 11-48b" /LENGTH=587 /DNA_ID=CAMNT_0049579221 /DNA_START=145 /DNA_END=1908 /DNA_ORIENTATION=-